MRKRDTFSNFSLCRVDFESVTMVLKMSVKNGVLFGLLLQRICHEQFFRAKVYFLRQPPRIYVGLSG